MIFSKKTSHTGSSRNFLGENIWGATTTMAFFQEYLGLILCGLDDGKNPEKDPRSMATFAFNMDALPRQVPIWGKGKSFKFSFGEVFCR